MHRDTTSGEVKGEYKYIPMFAFRRFGGHGWVCVHTSGHTWRGWDSCLLWTHRAQGEWQETEEEFRCETGEGRVGQQDGDGGEELIALHGEAPALSEREDFFSLFPPLRWSSYRIHPPHPRNEKGSQVSKLTELLWLLENTLSQNGSEGHRAHKTAHSVIFSF